ncbi:ankyrin repeat domain-containing protein [Legionella shakespearei]|uniref:Ankyrin repeats (3 copies) n=1 Tax=Legionella shakespearei DSM 23087 TaxID=1122169 RepID=A0A0W0YL39_9GAMM|nr:ankyrin repeat domain-containing protein [Legionella shakespearei]KTD57600.1 Ankyrin repeats (3 copies) [Legionella shakespearei DSM 23087]
MKALWNKDKKFLNSLEFINNNLMQLKQNMEADEQSVETFKRNKALYTKIIKSFENVQAYADGRSWGNEWRKAKKAWLAGTKQQLSILSHRMDELDGIKRQVTKPHGERQADTVADELEIMQIVDEIADYMGKIFNYDSTQKTTSAYSENELSSASSVPELADLQKACIDNDEPDIERIVTYFENYNKIDLLKKCACQFAAEGRVDALEQLMGHSTRIDYSLCDKEEWSLLHWAVVGNQKEMLLFLLKKSPVSILKNSTSYFSLSGSILNFTVEYCNLELFEALLSSEEVKSKLPELLLLKGRNGKRPLAITMIKIKELLSAEPNESMQQKYGTYLRMMERLFDLEHKVNASNPPSVMEQNFKNLTDKISAFYREMDVVKRYAVYADLSKYSNEITSGLSAAYKISAEDFMQHVKWCLQVPFLKACQENQIEIATQHANLFKEHGVESFINEIILDCLSYSSSESKTLVFKFIIDNGLMEPSKAVTDNLTNNGWNVLHWAVAKEKISIIEYLIHKDPNLAFIKTPNGWLNGRENLLHVAIAYGQKKSLKFILNDLTSDKYPDKTIQFKLFYFLINSKEKNGETPLALVLSKLNKAPTEYSLTEAQEMKKIIEDATTTMAANPEFQAYLESIEKDEAEKAKAAELKTEANKTSTFCSIM